MAGANYIVDKSFKPNAAVVQFRVVKATADKDGCAPCGLGERPLGVIQEEVNAADVTNGRAVAVRSIGITRAVAGAVLANDVPVRSDANGKMVGLAAATANQEQVGIVRTPAAADGDLITVQLTIGVQRTTV